MAGRTPSAAVRKFRRERLIGRYLVNPAVGLLDRLGIRSSLIAELETVGARSGQPRRVPVTASIDETGAWLISQHGYRSGWARNIAADPHIRLRLGTEWRTGTAFRARGRCGGSLAHLRQGPRLGRRRRTNDESAGERSDLGAHHLRRSLTAHRKSATARQTRRPCADNRAEAATYGRATDSVSVVRVRGISTGGQGCAAIR